MPRTPTLDDLLQIAPKNAVDCAMWALSLPLQQLRQVWVAVAVEQILDRRWSGSEFSSFLAAVRLRYDLLVQEATGRPSPPVELAPPRPAPERLTTPRLGRRRSGAGARVKEALRSLSPGDSVRVVDLFSNVNDRKLACYWCDRLRGFEWVSHGKREPAEIRRLRRPAVQTA